MMAGKKAVKSTGLSRFVREYTLEQKSAIYEKMMRNAIEKQRELMAKASKRRMK